MATQQHVDAGSAEMQSLMLSKGATRLQRAGNLLGQGFLFLITSLSTIAVLFIFYYIARDAIPFFRLEGFKEFFSAPNGILRLRIAASARYPFSSAAAWSHSALCSWPCRSGFQQLSV
jgi:ABC-type phosphate transport system permease subunit